MTVADYAPPVVPPVESMLELPECSIPEEPAFPCVRLSVNVNVNPSTSTLSQWPRRPFIDKLCFHVSVYFSR